MNPTELLQPRCKLTGTVPVLRETSHYFLDLPALTPQLQEYHDRAAKLGGWSSNCVQVCLGACWGWSLQLLALAGALHSIKNAAKEARKDA